MSWRQVAVGVDGARAGWIVASLLRDDATGERRTELELLPDVAALGAFREAGAPVAIDVPIGLADAGPRACDVQARRLLGRRGTSVFPAPARWMLAFADDYTALRAHVADRRRAGEPLASLSAQGHGIARKIKEVDDWLAANPSADDWLLECHPEVSFTAMNGGRPVDGQKKTAEGKAQRRARIAAAFPDAPTELDAAASRWRRSDVAIDDLHDAYACLHSALAVRELSQDVLGDGTRDTTGRPMQMILARPERPNHSVAQSAKEREG